MSIFNYQLTLQSEGINSGPYYNVTYTTSSVFYPVTAGSPAYLPNVGSTATVGIPSGSIIYLAFNLNNGVGGGCELCDNNVVYTVQGCPCVCGAEIINKANTQISYSYQDCYGNPFSGSIPTDATGSLPCGDQPFYVQISSITTTGPAVITYGSCSAPSPICCTPTLDNVSLSGGSVSVAFTLSGDSFCSSCSTVTIQSSSNGVNWGGAVTDNCTSPRLLPTASACTGSTFYYRVYQTCSGSVTSSFSNTGSIFISGSGTSCCPPSITSIEPVDITTSSLYINYSSGSGPCCIDCSYITLTTSSNGTTWGGAVTASCTGSQFTVTAPAPRSTRYYRVQQTCSGSVTSSFSATASFSNTYVEECSCYWFFNETGTSDTVTYTLCGDIETIESVGAGQSVRRCVSDSAPAPSSATVTITACTSTVSCTVNDDCTSCT